MYAHACNMGTKVIRKRVTLVTLFRAILIDVRLKEKHMSKYCPRCHCSTNVVKIGVTTANRQRYLCKRCKKTWVNKARPNRINALIHGDYFIHDLKLDYLCKKYDCSKNKLRKIIDEYHAPQIIPSGQHDVIGMDCTYFGRRGIDEWGLLIIVDLHLGQCLYCEEILGHETYAHYCMALDRLAGFGVYPKACVIDGVTGLAGVLELRGMAVQYCQFHQIKTINSYLTRNPILEPNIELRKIALSLTHVNRQIFISMFNAWYAQNKMWLNEKTRNPDTGKLEYSHQKTRSAVHSLQRNFKYLYTFEKYPELKIPNTNNMLEGLNSAIKHKLNHHRGARKELKIKLVRTFLSNRTGV